MARHTIKDGKRMFELLVPVILSIVLAVLAIPFGADSREGLDRRPESLGIVH
jgi:hypothetical protein